MLPIGEKTICARWTGPFSIKAGRKSFRFACAIGLPPIQLTPKDKMKKEPYAPADSTFWGAFTAWQDRGYPVENVDGVLVCK